MTHDSAVTAAAEALNVHRWKSMGVSSVECECGAILTSTEPPLTKFPADEVFRQHMAEAMLSAARPIIEAEVRERCGPDHVLGQPCHHLYGRCFPTDAELLEYRQRQREHGARKERERLAAAIHDFFDEPEGTTSHSPDWYVAAEIAEDIAQGNV